VNSLAKAFPCRERAQEITASASASRLSLDRDKMMEIRAQTGTEDAPQINTHGSAANPKEIR
jgi:hypothetical protein